MLVLHVCLYLSTGSDTRSAPRAATSTKRFVLQGRPVHQDIYVSTTRSPDPAVRGAAPTAVISHSDDLHFVCVYFSRYARVLFSDMYVSMLMMHTFCMCRIFSAFACICYYTDRVYYYPLTYTSPFLCIIAEGECECFYSGNCLL